MKKMFYILMIAFPIIVCTQQVLAQSSPLDYAWKYVGDAGISAGQVYYTSLAFNPIDGNPYVAYQDYADSLRATVMKFNGFNWELVGNAGFSAASAYFISLAFRPSDGQPYVAYQDWGQPAKATVMTFDGSNWVNVGNAGFSIGEADDISLAFSPSGEPYVAYIDVVDNVKATVMRFDGTNWVNVGNAGFSADTAVCTSLAFSPSGEPYVAYVDYANSRKVTVMKFDGSSWLNVGNAGFSGENSSLTNLVFNPFDGQPYVAFTDVEDSSKATVMKFDGTSWSYVGNRGCSEKTIYAPSLAFNSTDGFPYMAFAYGVNLSEDNNLTVMKFNGTNWVGVGTADFARTLGSYISLAFPPSGGQPYVAFPDYGNFKKVSVMKYDSAFNGIKVPQQARLSIYPNPATDIITIETSGATRESNLVFLNIEGQQLITRQLTQPKTQLDISSLPSRVYFVRLTSDKSVATGKIIKQ